MSYLMFMDESGHDHKNMPYEVRGGIVLHASVLWKFVRDVMALEQDCFGTLLYQYKAEIKGHKLLDKDRFVWSRQMDALDAITRRQNAVSFLRKGIQKESQPTRLEFTAYGQASLTMARGIFGLLHNYDVQIFATVIPRSVIRPQTEEAEEYLRKDHVFLLQRYYYMLEQTQQNGLLVMDETDQKLDRWFVRQMNRYFTRTASGQQRATRIVPIPFFVRSDMTYPIQVADVCIYCINCAFRVQGMDGGIRQEIADMFLADIARLQWQGDVNVNGEVYRNFGVVYVPDPYTRRQ